MKTGNIWITIMKRLFYIFLLFLTINIYSSSFEFGLKAGVNSNYVSINNLAGDEYSFDRTWDYLFGVISRVNLNYDIFIQFEILYNRRGFDVKEKEISIFFRTHYLDFPFFIGKKIYNNIELYLGLYVGKYLDSYGELDVYEESQYKKDRTFWGGLDQEMNSTDMGYLLGISYNWKGLFFDLRYTRSLTKLNSQNPETFYTSRMDYVSQWSFNIGYFF